MPFWLFYPRRPSSRLLTQSWKAISRPFDAWWPPRLASRLSPSFLSKNVAHMSLDFPAFISFKYTYVELLVTGMLCHSKVWSRVWTHRCNVNMNPYISVYPLSVSVSFLLIVFRVFLSCLSTSRLFFYLSSAFISDVLDGFFRGEVMSFTLFSRIACVDHFILYDCVYHIFKSSFWVTEMYERNCIYFFITCSCEVNEPELDFL